MFEQSRSYGRVVAEVPFFFSSWAPPSAPVLIFRPGLNHSRREFVERVPGSEVPAPRSTPGVSDFQVFVPGTCSLSHSCVSTRVFCSLASGSRLRPADVHTSSQGPRSSSLEIGEKNRRKKKGEKERKTETRTGNLYRSFPTAVNTSVGETEIIARS